jgi:molybdenum cofactor cytidylyltransferase
MTDGNEQRMSLGVIILAAGASRRMGKPKLLLPWEDTSILGHLIGQWQKAEAEQITVVAAAGDEPLEQELRRLKFPEGNRIPNPTPELGMFSSIRCAARWPGWRRNLRHWVIVLGDQPHLSIETLMALLRVGATNPQRVCQLSRQGHPRHPVLLPHAAFKKLGLSKHRTLKEFLESVPSDVVLQESKDEGLDLDIDHPADYERAIGLYKSC